MADGQTNSDSLLRMPIFPRFPTDLSKSLLTSFHAISTSTLGTGLCWWSFRRPALVPLVRDRTKGDQEERKLARSRRGKVLLIYA